MHFCAKCDNMYYITIADNDENQLVYYCRNCGHKDIALTAENICVSKIQIKRNEHKYIRAINKYTKLDPTLPRVNNIQCPNEHCISNTDDQVTNEVIYIRYDDANMKFIYLCTRCDVSWKTAEQK